MCLRRRLDLLDDVVQQKRKPWQYNARCPACGRESLSITTGRYVHIIYECHASRTGAGCTDSAVYVALIQAGFPRGCLAKPKDSSSDPRPENTVANQVSEILAGPGTHAQRLVLIAIAVSGNLPRGEAECAALGSKIRVSGRVVYEASAPLRRGLVR